MVSEFWSEWVFYTDDDDKKEAYEYLRLWKKYILIRYPHYEFIQEQYVDRQNLEDFKGNPSGKSTLGIKIEMMMKNENKSS